MPIRIHTNLSFLTHLSALRHFRPRETSGHKLLDTSGRETLPTLRHFRHWDKSGPETSPTLRQVRTSAALKHFLPWDISSPKTSQEKSSPKTFLALRHFFKKIYAFMINKNFNLVAPRHFRPRQTFGHKHFWPRDTSGPETSPSPKTSQDKFGPETFPALRHVRP